MAARPLSEKFLVAFSFAGEQRDFVRAMAEAVEKELGRGKVFFDEWFEAHLAGDGADLKLQRIYNQDCALAVVCVSHRYGGKAWTQTEHAAIRARVMKARVAKDDTERYGVLPIRVGDGDVEGVLFNEIVPDVRERGPEKSAVLIVDRLRLVMPNLKTTSRRRPSSNSWPSKPPSLAWPMADHGGAREAFAELLTSKTRWRFLPIRGGSETGKSHVTRQMLANVLAIPDIACGRFDFKGTTDMDREIRSFIQELDVSPPPSSPRLHERLDHILGGLRLRSHPTLLIFDTYEMAGETQDWVEKQLLPSLIRATWLRVVIAGQRAPDSTGSVWTAVARTTLQLEPPPAADWFDYGKQHRSDLTLAKVQTACDLAEQKASLLAQLLGPKK